MTTMADNNPSDTVTLAGLGRDLDTVTPGAACRRGPWVCAAISCALHGLVLFGVVWAGLLDLPREPSLAEQVVEIDLTDLAGLAGQVGAGGDGEMPGGGDGLPVALPESAAPATDAASAADVAPAVQATPAPETVLLPDPDAPAPPEQRPEPQPQPAPRPKPETKRPPPAKISPRPARPTDRAAAASAGGLAVEAGRNPAAAGPVQAGSGPAGSGDGKGPGNGPGAGGFGGEGLAGGGGGDYVGVFGQGDGPTFRRRPLPSYPSEAKRANLEGKVSLRLFIDSGGVLRNVEVMEHSGLEFVEEAVKALRASSFSPAKRNGQSVASRAMLTIRFKLN